MEVDITKLAAFRDKDRDFVRVLLQHGMIDETVLRERISSSLPVDDELRGRMLIWLDKTMRLLATRET